MVKERKQKRECGYWKKQKVNIYFCILTREFKKDPQEKKSPLEKLPFGPSGILRQPPCMEKKWNSPMCDSKVMRV